MFQTKQYTILSPILPEAFDGWRLVHISDLHGRVWGTNHCDLMEAVDQAMPDAVMLTGDIFGEKASGYPDTLALCKSLADRYPVYFISGNHEANIEELLRNKLYYKLRKSGVTMLDNKSMFLYGHPSNADERSYPKKAQKIRLCGLVLPSLYYKDPLVHPYDRQVYFSSQQIEEQLGSINPEEFTILLAHNPMYFPSYRDWGADLTLAGHIHGGIIRIPGMGGLLSPEVCFFPKYDGGLFTEIPHTLTQEKSTESKKNMVVSRGLSSTIGVRINNPMELVTVTLNLSSRGKKRIKA